MNKIQQLEALKLLNATLDILNKCDKSALILNVMEQTSIWDNVECDGYCLRDEIEELLIDIENKTK